MVVSANGLIGNIYPDSIRFEPLLIQIRSRVFL